MNFFIFVSPFWFWVERLFTAPPVPVVGY
jgi:hypothetical protein